MSVIFFCPFGLFGSTNLITAMESELDQLADGARRGDRAAAASLIGQSYERIYAFLRRLSGNDTDAADLTQLTFTRVWKSLPSFVGRSSFSSWAHGIAYHVYVDWRRSNHRTEHRSDEWWAACRASQAQPDEVATERDLASSLYASVDGLSNELRDTVHLHYYQELTLQETADAQNVATSTVKYRLRQALAQLNKKMAADQIPSTSLRSL